MKRPCMLNLYYPTKFRKDWSAGTESATGHSVYSRLGVHELPPSPLFNFLTIEQFRKAIH